MGSRILVLVCVCGILSWISFCMIYTSSWGRNFARCRALHPSALMLSMFPLKHVFGHCLEHLYIRTCQLRYNSFVSSFFRLFFFVLILVPSNNFHRQSFLFHDVDLTYSNTNFLHLLPGNYYKPGSSNSLIMLLRSRSAKCLLFSNKPVWKNEILFATPPQLSWQPR